jgi:hypothetical protein
LYKLRYGIVPLTRSLRTASSQPGTDPSKSRSSRTPSLSAAQPGLQSARPRHWARSDRGAADVFRLTSSSGRPAEHLHIGQLLPLCSNSQRGEYQVFASFAFSSRRLYAPCLRTRCSSRTASFPRVLRVEFQIVGSATVTCRLQLRSCL